jgi:nitrogen fixation/metabolism regulation signal transduction histidine kinase
LKPGRPGPILLIDSEHRRLVLVRIRSKLQVGAALSITITLVICAVLFLASRRVDTAVAQSSAAHRVVESVFESNLLLNDFLLRHREKTAAEWQSKHEALGKLLPELSVGTAEEERALKEVRESHGKTMALFLELVTGNREQRRNRDEIIGYLDLEEKVVGRLSAESQSMVSHARSLADASHANAVRAQQRATLLVVAFTAVVTVVLAVTLIALAGAVVRPITKLKEATGVIAGGNLEHRVDIDSNDEIGELASAFNEMTAKLKDSYVALQNSFNEMARKLREARKE